MWRTRCSSDKCVRSHRAHPPALKSILDALHLFQGALDERVRKWSIVKAWRKLFAVRIGPLQELDELLALGVVLLVSVHEQPRRAGYRVGLLAGGIHHGEPEVVGNRGGREGLGDRLDGRGHVVARGVPQAGVAQVVLLRVGQLGVAYRAGHLLHLARDALVALAAYADRPAHGGSLPDLFLPGGAHLAQIVREYVGGAAPVRAVDNDDVQVGQFGVRVLAGDGRVIPLRYLGKEDLGYGLAVELDHRFAGEVVGDHVGAGDR